MPRSNSLTNRIPASIFVAVIVGCGGDSTAPPDKKVEHGIPASIAIVAGNNQKGFVRSAVPVNPSVQVKDHLGNVVAGATVRFEITVGGGSLASPVVATDASGNASTAWTLGASVGTNRITASATGTEPVTF